MAGHPDTVDYRYIWVVQGLFLSLTTVFHRNNNDHCVNSFSIVPRNFLISD
jgi:hypothetical protein